MEYMLVYLDSKSIYHCGFVAGSVHVHSVPGRIHLPISRLFAGRMTVWNSRRLSQMRLIETIKCPTGIYCMRWTTSSWFRKT